MCRVLISDKTISSPLLPLKESAALYTAWKLLEHSRASKTTTPPSPSRVVLVFCCDGETMKNIHLTRRRTVAEPLINV